MFGDARDAPNVLSCAERYLPATVPKRMPGKVAAKTCFAFHSVLDFLARKLLPWSRNVSPCVYGVSVGAGAL